MEPRLYLRRFTGSESISKSVLSHGDDPEFCTPNSDILVTVTKTKTTIIFYK